MTLLEWVGVERGRQTLLGQALGVDSQLVWAWANEHAGRKVPLERCVDIEKATAGEVTCEELRPDRRDYFAYLRGVSGEGAD